MAGERKPTLDELNATGPPTVDSSTSTRSPIGVPAGFSVVSPDSLVNQVRSDVNTISGGRLRPMATPPRYFDGDEWKPASLSAAKVAELQRKMAAAGLFGKKGTYRNGVWDAKSADAYAEVLAYANASGMDDRTALSRFVAQPSGEDSPARQPLVKRLSNPDDLRATFETVARSKIGRKVPPEEVERMVRAYQAEEASTQQRAYDLDETGGTVVDVANPQAFAAARIAKEYGVEAGAHDIAEQGNEFFDLLREVGG